MIVCYQYKVYPKPFYGRSTESYYYFSVSNSFGLPDLYLRNELNLLEPIAAWRIKKLH